ncbi:MAG: nitrogen regulatory IIA protein [Taibaiella sp.]|nr:nitrogen regulatory IIA protein [Taibaiella sp.]
MKKMKASLRGRAKELEQRWNCLPLKKQQTYIRLLFVAYALLTVIVLIYESSGDVESGDKVKVEHIKIPDVPGGKSPAALQDTVSIIIKNKLYEKI